MLSSYLETSYVQVVPPVLGFFVLTALSLVAVVTGGRKRTNRLFAGICFMGALINADVALVNIVSDERLAITIDRCTYLFFFFSPALYIQFIHAFLGIASRQWLEKVGYAVGVVFLFFLPTEHFIAGFNRYEFGMIARGGMAFHAFSTIAGLTVAYCLVNLIKAYQGTESNQKRNRIQYIIGGLGLSSLMLAMNILPVSGFNVYPLGNFSFIPAIVLGVGVLKYDLLDMDAYVRRGVLYFSLTIALTLVYFVFISLLNLAFMDTAWHGTVAFPFLLALGMVFLFNPIKSRLQYLIDRIFFRGKYEYRELLRELSGRLATLVSFEDIRRLIAESVAEALQVSHITLYVWEDGEGPYKACDLPDQQACRLPDIEGTHPLILSLKRTGKPLSDYSLDMMSRRGDGTGIPQAFRDLDASLIIPMIARDEVIGLIVLGQKKSGQLFVYEDVELLTTIANQSAVALEKARIYGELEQLNQALEKKVEERTAALRQAMEATEKARAQLVRSESLAAIGQLVAGTAHELNNPLASASSLIQTSLETIREGNLQEEDRKEIVDDLDFSLVEVKRASDIVKSLLSLSRQTSTYMEPVNLNTVMDDALRVLHSQFKHLPLQITRCYDMNLPQIDGNFANLGQVFINVIKNAIQALPEGKGEIVLTTSYDTQRELVVAECRDSGPGIPHEQLKDIFKPFFTTKGVGRGTGLGLYICHEIVQRHGGAIWASSPVGKGTSFWIELPLRRRET